LAPAEHDVLLPGGQLRILLQVPLGSAMGIGLENAINAFRLAASLWQAGLLAAFLPPGLQKFNANRDEWNHDDHYVNQVDVGPDPGRPALPETEERNACAPQQGTQVWSSPNAARNAAPANTPMGT